jgi:hypothetical protein
VGRVRRLTLTLAAFFALLVLAGPASASPYAQYGIQDDAWLQYGSGSLDERLQTLDELGVDIVRYTIDWRAVERSRGNRDWSSVDPILNGLRAHGIPAVVTIWGTPRWANGGRSANWAPNRAADFANFAAAAAKRYRHVKKWLIWNEPNQRRWLRPTSARTYVTKLLNPAYRSMHNVSRGVKIGAGVTAPRGAYKGLSPVDFIRGMRASRAKLDAYAHHPYPLRRQETPFAGGCDHCSTITMATLDRLLREVKRAWGNKRIWLTEYGYQTNPPDRALGVSRALQARYHAEASRKVHATPRVDMLIHYLYQDEPSVDRWQSGLMSVSGVAKPARRAFALPLAQASRRVVRTVLWGQVRPGSGRQRYILQQFRGGKWRSVGGARRTTARGYLTRTVRAGKGAKFRIWYPAYRLASPIVKIS